MPVGSESLARKNKERQMVTCRVRLSFTALRARSSNLDNFIAVIDFDSAKRNYTLVVPVRNLALNAEKTTPFA
jgi:hypothetical protein